MSDFVDESLALALATREVSGVLGQRGVLLSVGGSRVLREVHLQSRSRTRAVCARLAFALQELGAPQVSPYGGETPTPHGRLALQFGNDNRGPIYFRLSVVDM